MIVPLLLLLLCSSASAHTWPRHCRDARAPLLCRVHKNVNRTNHLRRRMQQAPIAYQWLPEHYPARRARYLRYWIAVRRDTERRWTLYQQAPWLHWAGGLCIHGYEGAWNAYNPAGPYYGGMQMDASFMQHWGADMLAKYSGRDARYWSAADQLRVAWRAHLHLGYSPWPNTSRMCGL